MFENGLGAYFWVVFGYFAGFWVVWELFVVNTICWVNLMKCGEVFDNLVLLVH